MIKDINGNQGIFKWQEPELTPIEVATNNMKLATRAYQKACYENVVLLAERAEKLRNGS